jgi:hypothetical protein
LGRHLKKAFGQRNRPPPVKKAGSRLDQMLVHRQNRYIGISREGSVALSWPTDDSNVQFERVTWPKLFQGVYLILALHAYYLHPPPPSPTHPPPPPNHCLTAVHHYS